MSGLVHVYIGDGKGKTTASVGLSVRAAGRDKKVVFAQFLKSGVTGELRSFETLGIPVIRSEIHLGFTHQMDEAAKAACTAEQQKVWRRVQEMVQTGISSAASPGTSSAASPGPVDLLVLDEVLDAINMKMLDELELRSFIENKPEDLEVVITGRNPSEWLMERADYFTEMKKIKHPYNRGIKARIGIEK
jgi:cob(I)alamin adenosyltransferase